MSEQGCTPFYGCGEKSITRQFDGSATLYSVDGGYSGSGKGTYNEVEDSKQNIPGPGCSQGVTSRTVTAGAAELTVNVQFSIDNDVTGGIDTAALPRNTSVVEVIVSGMGLGYQRSSQSCGTPSDLSHSDASVGFDCHFYGVDLETGGSYTAKKDGAEDSGTCTLDIGPAAVKLRVEGLVTGAFGPNGPGGQTPLPGSRVALAALQKLDALPQLLMPLEPLSRSKPGYLELTRANENARYEIELPGGAPPGDLPRLLVVSALWYAGPPEFAVTAARAADGTFIPVYQALCVDDVAGTPCLKWREEGDGNYVATVDFVHGSEAKLADNRAVVELEAWEGRRTTAENLAYGAYAYYHSYRAMKYFETLSLSVPWNGLMIKVQHSGNDCTNGAYYDAPPRLRGGPYPTFGDLGGRLDTVTAHGSGIYICTLYDWTGSSPTVPLWHEIGHYLQFEMYEPYNNKTGTPHDGYKNEGTNDSIIEGFASFVAMLINEHYGASPASVFHGENLELDYKVWGTSGVWGASADDSGAEENAVTGVLWDFYDRGTEINLGQRIDGAIVPVSKVYPVSTDDAQVSAARILTVIDRNEVKDLVQLREAFGATGTVSRVGIDMIYVNHGIFADVVERNYVHDSAAETIGETGSSSSPDRPVRRSPKPALPGAYLLSEVDAAYRVAVEFDEPYSSYDYMFRLALEGGVRTGFVMPPPDYISTATLTPLGENDAPLPGAIVITSDEFWNYVRSGPAADGVFRTLGP